MWILGFSAIVGLILTLAGGCVAALTGDSASGLQLLQMFATVTGILAVILWVLQVIVTEISIGVERVLDKNHAAYVQDLQQRGFTPQQIQDKVDDPGLFVRHSGKVMIVALILLACFVPITLPLLGIYGLHMLWGWRHMKDDVREYEATRGGPPILEEWEKDAHERSSARPQEPDLFRHFGR